MSEALGSWLLGIEVWTIQFAFSRMSKLVERLDSLT